MYILCIIIVLCLYLLNLTFHISRQLIVLIKGMLMKKIINASSNLKKDLHLETIF